MPTATLIDHLRHHALLTGRFTLRSGEETTWYVDARRTTFDGPGARLVGDAVLGVLEPEVVAVGGMTMGADPIAVATAVIAAERDRPLRSFSVRKEEKEHGVGGRLVGPVESGMTVAVLEDTTTTGGSMMAAVEVARSEGLIVTQAITLVDRSEGVAEERFAAEDVPFVALVTPDQLGVDVS